MKKQPKWRASATADELREVSAIDKELKRLNTLRSVLSVRRYKIQNRANVRANREGV